MKPILLSLLIVSSLAVSCNHKSFDVQELPSDPGSSQSVDSSFFEYPGTYVGSMRLLQSGGNFFHDTTYTDTISITVIPGDSFTVSHLWDPSNPDVHSSFAYNDSDFYEYISGTEQKRVWLYPDTDSIEVEQVMHYSIGGVNDYRFKGKKL